MPSTLLQIVQEALAEQGLTTYSPTTVAGATDDTGRQMLALANRVVQKTITRYQAWPQLTREWLVTLPAPVQATGFIVAGGFGVSGIAVPPGVTANQWTAAAAGLSSTCRVQEVHTDGTLLLSEPATATGLVTITFAQDTFPLPDDVDSITANTGWDRSKRWRLVGPLTPQEDQAIKCGLIQAMPYYRFRIAGQPPYLILRPAAAAFGTLSFEYYGRGGVMAADGTFKTTFTADTDVSVFPDELMVPGLIYLFRRAKGFDYGGPKSDYDRAVGAAYARSTPARTVSLAPRDYNGPHMLDYNNVPDGFYPGYI